MLFGNSEIVPNITVDDCKVAMRVLEAIGGFVEQTQGKNDISDALILAYAFLNATIQHGERLHSDFDNKPHGFGSL